MGMIAGGDKEISGASVGQEVIWKTNSKNPEFQSAGQPHLANQLIGISLTGMMASKLACLATPQPFEGHFNVHNHPGLPSRPTNVLM